MKTYISILRGINVSGHKKILMADLKALFEQIGFENVVTYIQSGNVVFKSKNEFSIKELSSKVETAIFETYQFEVPVLILTPEELKSIVENNPFFKVDGFDSERVYFTFLADKPDNEKVEIVSKLTFFPDEFIIHDKSVYIYCPVSYGKSKLNNNFFENKLKIKATTRNWKTTVQLLELCS